MKPKLSRLRCGTRCSAAVGERPLYVLAGHGLAGPQSDAASDKPAGPPRSAPLTLALRVRLTSGGLDYAPHAILVQPCARFVPGVWGRCYFQSIEGTRERGERAGAAGDQTRETLRHEVEACTNSRRRAFETRITVHPRLTHLDLIASTTSTAGMKRPGSREPPPRRWS
jgi:hypothetical protein